MLLVPYSPESISIGTSPAHYFHASRQIGTVSAEFMSIPSKILESLFQYFFHNALLFYRKIIGETVLSHFSDFNANKNIRKCPHRTITSINKSDSAITSISAAIIFVVTVLMWMKKIHGIIHTG